MLPPGIIQRPFTAIQKRLCNPLLHSIIIHSFTLLFFPHFDAYQVGGQPMAAPVKKVMISSTARDLPEHRDLVKDACLRQGMLPIMMEHLPASDADAIAES